MKVRQNGRNLMIRGQRNDRQTQLFKAVPCGAGVADVDQIEAERDGLHVSV